MILANRVPLNVWGGGDYVTRKAWTCAIPGLSCANPGSMVCGSMVCVQTMDWPRNPGIVRAQSMDQDNPGIALRKAYRSDMSACNI